MSEIKSGITLLKVKDDNPFTLFHDWNQKASKYMPEGSIPNKMYLATVTSKGSPSNRTVLLRKLDDEGFFIMVNKHSRKCQDIAFCQNVAATFCWTYLKDGTRIAKQVRIEGIANKQDASVLAEEYNNEPLHCKIRSHIYEDGPVERDVLEEKHRKILEELKSGKQLGMPDNLAVYKIIPNTMEFYCEWDTNIADRVFFSKEANGKWVHHHLSA